MATIRKRYTTEFKQEAVRLALQGNVPKSQVARELGLTDKMLYSWINHFGPAKSDQPIPLTTDERDELMRLRRELKRTQEERDILKKALGICSMER